MSQSNLDSWLEQANGLEITSSQMMELLAFVESEYPSDPMMQELRMIRNIRAMRKGLSAEDLLNDYRKAA